MKKEHPGTKYRLFFLHVTYYVWELNYIMQDMWEKFNIS